MATRLTAVCLAAAIAALLWLPARQALADVIDGEWCRPGGKHMSIKGPDIVTPAGTRTKGNYSRHAFSYVVPDADPGAGKTVFMLLLNEETVHLRIGADAADAAQAEVEVWHRCNETTSELRRRPGHGAVAAAAMAPGENSAGGRVSDESRRQRPIGSVARYPR